MLARELMTSPVVTIDPEATLKHAIQVLDRYEITSMPVVDSGRLVGIVSEADLLRDDVPADPRAHVRPIAEGQPRPERTVGEVMTPNVIYAHEGDDVAAIIRMMLETGVKSVPVVAGRRVVGVVSRRDMVHALARRDEHIRADVESLLADAGLVGWEVRVTDGSVELLGGTGRDLRLALTMAQTVSGTTGARRSDTDSAV